MGSWEDSMSNTKLPYTGLICVVFCADKISRQPPTFLRELAEATVLQIEANIIASQACECQAWLDGMHYIKCYNAVEVISER